MRLRSAWTAAYEHCGQKGPATEPSVFQQDGRRHQVPWEHRLISWKRILMWHLAVEKYHLGNGRGAVLCPGIIHSASGWLTGLVASPVFWDTLCFTDKNLTLYSAPHYMTHLSVWVRWQKRGRNVKGFSYCIERFVLNSIYISTHLLLC